MIAYHTTEVNELAIHFVGNKHNGDLLILSDQMVAIKEQRLRDLLTQYFTQSYKVPEYYSFTINGANNQMYHLCKSIFENKHELHKASLQMAKWLYDACEHPNIKSGDLLITYLSELIIDGEVCDAIGIIKSENTAPFIQLNHNEHIYNMQIIDGIDVNKIDKGCIIFNTQKEEGYKICVIDKANKNQEAFYWTDEFLQVTIQNNAYLQTGTFMGIAKEYIATQFPQDFESSKTEQIDLLQRSMQYFKKNNDFDKEKFTEEVFHFPQVIDSFQKFDNQYRLQNDITIDDQFDISAPAVRKQNKFFKSVIKLDKNFHIYVHGGKDLMEKGVDEQGRKFYKVFYYEES
jgi:hypothetical protein